MLLSIACVHYSSGFGLIRLVLFWSCLELESTYPRETEDPCLFHLMTGLDYRQKYVRSCEVLDSNVFSLVMDNILVVPRLFEVDVVGSWFWDPFFLLVSLGDFPSWRRVT